MGGFYKKKCGARELLAKEKKGLFLDQDLPFWGKGNGKGFIMQIASSAAGDGGVDGEGPCDSLIYWCLTRKFQTGPLTLHF